MIIYDNRKWWQQLLSFDGTILPNLLFRLSFFVAYAAMVTLLHKYDTRVPMVPIFAHSIIGLALGYLLVFRTNASYDRYWEGRKAWGGIINSIRFLFAAAQAAAPHSIGLLSPLVLAFPIVLKNHLRGEKNFRELKTLFDDDLLAKLASVSNPPLVVASLILDWINTQRLSKSVPSSAADAMYRAAQVVMDCQGVCERIKKTPIPFAYVVHIQQLLTLYLLTVPFAIIEDFGWWTPVAVFLIGFAFMGIEDAGIEIEDPFGSDAADLPLERFCQTVGADIKDMVKFRAEVPQAFGRSRPTLAAGQQPTFPRSPATPLMHQLPYLRHGPGRAGTTTKGGFGALEEIVTTGGAGPSSLHRLDFHMEPPDEADSADHQTEPDTFLSHVSKLSSEVSACVSIETLADRSFDMAQKSIPPKPSGSKIVMF